MERSGYIYIYTHSSIYTVVQPKRFVDTLDTEVS